MFSFILCHSLSTRRVNSRLLDTQCIFSKEKTLSLQLYLCLSFIYTIYIYSILIYPFISQWIKEDRNGRFVYLHSLYPTRRIFFFLTLKKKERKRMDNITSYCRQQLSFICCPFRCKLNYLVRKERELISTTPSPQKKGLV